MTKEILAVNAALLFIEKMFPLIESGLKSGEVSASDQVLLRARYEELRAKGDSLFKQPHWDV